MKEHARNGKIARLPQALREEINLRLADGATARKLVAWLNRLPEVQALVRDEFDGHPIREQNISQWRNGGYEEWLRQLEAVALAEHLYEQAKESEERTVQRLPMTQVLKIWLTSRYTVATREVERAEGPEGWRKLRQMCVDVVKLRRMDLDAEKMEVERERNEIQRLRVELQREKLEMQRARQAAKGGRRDEVEAKENAAEPEQGGGDGAKIVPVPRAAAGEVEAESARPPVKGEEDGKPWKEPLGAAA